MTNDEIQRDGGEVVEPREEQPEAVVQALPDEAGEAAAEGGQRVPWWRGIVEFVVAFAIMIAAITALRTFVIEPFQIPSGSMLETIQIGDRIFAEKVSVKIDPMPDQGEIVTFVNPRDESEILIKRVVATEGQVIDFRDGIVYIDGVALDEPYTNGQLTRPMRSDLSYAGAVVGIDAQTGAAVLNESGARTNEQIAYPYTVPQGYFWAMGDNRGNSADSRVFGPVSEELVTGRAVLRYWPIFYVAQSDALEVELGPLTFTVPMSLSAIELALGPLD